MKKANVNRRCSSWPCRGLDDGPESGRRPVDVLGAHNNSGRGCAGCHAPHSGSFGSGHGGGADSGSYALWGQDASPLYGKTIASATTAARYVEVLPTASPPAAPKSAAFCSA